MGWEAWSCGVLAKSDGDHVAVARGLERALEAGMGVAFEAPARVGVLGVVDELADHRAQMPDDDRRIELNAAVLAPAVFAGPGLDREIDQAVQAARIEGFFVAVFHSTPCLRSDSSS